MAGTGTSASDCHLDLVTISINERLERLSPPSNCCIFTVPMRLRRANDEAYTPRVVAIGPYHRLNPSLMPMEYHKLLYLQHFLQHNQNNCLEDYIQRVKSWEDAARNCYDKQIDLSSHEFTEMMLLDGIFVIQLFLMYRFNELRLHSDQIFNKPYMFKDVRRDMALLENQMPFFVIERLFEMAFGTHQEHMPELLELVCYFFKPFTRMEKLPERVLKSEVKHFVHAISFSFWPSNTKLPPEYLDEMKPAPSATELVMAGVKLKKHESKCFDIEFKNGELHISHLALYNWTESYFRNVITFEQGYCRNWYLTNYMAFMDHLVDTPGDAEILIDEGIIENWLSNKEAVAQLFNTFGKEVGLSAGYNFCSLSKELINHCEQHCNKWKATFKHDYCSSPWVVISVIAAVVLLLLTVAQTVCSILSLI